MTEPRKVHGALLGYHGNIAKQNGGQEKYSYFYNIFGSGLSRIALALQSHTCIGYRDNTHFYKDYGNILSLSCVLPVHLEARTK